MFFDLVKGKLSTFLHIYIETVPAQLFSRIVGICPLLVHLSQFSKVDSKKSEVLVIEGIDVFLWEGGELGGEDGFTADRVLEADGVVSKPVPVGVGHPDIFMAEGRVLMAQVVSLNHLF